jgi:uncharacterized protein (TIGR02594 family)
MKYRLFAALLFTASCMQAEPVPEQINIAKYYLGLDEDRNRYELKLILGVDPAKTEWCAAFVNAMLKKDNIPGSDSVSDYPLMARSFLTWGTRVRSNDIKTGDVVVFPRGSGGWQGHVGFYYGTTPKGEWVILGGNQDNTVSYKMYAPNKAIAIRRWEKEIE